MKVIMQIIFQPIIYFMLSFRIFTVIEEHLEKRTGFDTVEEIVILKLVEGVMSAPENNKDIDVGWQCSQCLSSIHVANHFHTVKSKISPNFQVRKFSVNAQFRRFSGESPEYLRKLCV